MAYKSQVYKYMSKFEKLCISKTNKQGLQLSDTYTDIHNPTFDTLIKTQQLTVSSTLLSTSPHQQPPSQPQLLRPTCPTHISPWDTRNHFKYKYPLRCSI
jgi:hypothetical protein